MRFFPLEKLINLENDYTRQFKIDALQLLLIQRDGERYLIESNCPHRDNPLDVATIENGSIRCPLHNYLFALKGGELLHATEEPCRALRTYELVYEGNEIGFLLDDEPADI